MQADAVGFKARTIALPLGEPIQLEATNKVSIRVLKADNSPAQEASLYFRRPAVEDYVWQGGSFAAKANDQGTWRGSIGLVCMVRAQLGKHTSEWAHIEPLRTSRPIKLILRETQMTNIRLHDRNTGEQVTVPAIHYMRSSDVPAVPQIAHSNNGLYAVPAVSDLCVGIDRHTAPYCFAFDIGAGSARVAKMAGGTLLDGRSRSGTFLPLPGDWHDKQNALSLPVRRIYQDSWLQLVRPDGQPCRDIRHLVYRYVWTSSFPSGPRTMKDGPRQASVNNGFAQCIHYLEPEDNKDTVRLVVAADGHQQTLVPRALFSSKKMPIRVVMKPSGQLLRVRVVNGRLPVRNVQVTVREFVDIPALDSRDQPRTGTGHWDRNLGLTDAKGAVREARLSSLPVELFCDNRKVRTVTARDLTRSEGLLLDIGPLGSISVDLDQTASTTIFCVDATAMVRSPQVHGNKATFGNLPAGRYRIVSGPKELPGVLMRVRMDKKRSAWAPPNTSRPTLPILLQPGEHRRLAWSGAASQARIMKGKVIGPNEPAFVWAIHSPWDPVIAIHAPRTKTNGTFELRVAGEALWGASVELFVKGGTLASTRSRRLLHLANSPVGQNIVVRAGSVELLLDESLPSGTRLTCTVASSLAPPSVQLQQFQLFCNERRVLIPILPVGKFTIFGLGPGYTMRKTIDVREGEKSQIRLPQDTKRLVLKNIFKR